MMPLFLLGLFGTFWAVRESALSERIQEGVRYGGLVSAQTNPYTSYSLYAMYSLLDGGTLPLGRTSCTVDLGPSLTANRGTFWQPASPPTFTCKPSTSLVGGATQNLLLQDIYLNATTSSPVDGYLTSHVLGTTTTPLSAAQNYFRSPDVGTLMSCTSVGADLKISLEGGSDTTTATSAATPLPLAPNATSVFGGPLTCVTFAGASPKQSYTPLVAPPTLSPTPSPTPTPTPTQTPAPTPTPTSTPKPTPTPVPTPTASPAPTGTPVPTPTPCDNGDGEGDGKGNCACKGDKGDGNCNTPPPTATPAPTPTPTPVPTPTPTPDPYGTPPGGLKG